jgi:hypothetical protein
MASCQSEDAVTLIKREREREREREGRVMVVRDAGFKEGDKNFFFLRFKRFSGSAPSPSGTGTLERG